MDNHSIVRMLLIVILLGAMVIGCRRGSGIASDDGVAQELNRLRPTATRFGFSDRVDFALALWKNGVKDAKPFLIRAALGHTDGEQEPLLLYLFDEDDDLLGLGIREEYIAPDGTERTLAEEYPVFSHRATGIGPLDYCHLPVRIRNAGQEKDTQLWQGYVAGEGVDVNRTRTDRQYRRQVLPPIWISRPEPNAVDVHVYLYDRAGNRSEPIRPEIHPHQDG